MLNNKNKRTNEKDHLKIRLQNYNRSSLRVESYIEIVRVGWVGVRQLSGTGSKYRERALHGSHGQLFKQKNKKSIVT